jgi:phage terminase large subunit-like protein
MTETQIDFRPTKPQRGFITSDARNSAFIGGIGSGKTRASVIKAISMPPNTVGMLVAPTFGMLRDTIVRTFADMMQQGAAHARQVQPIGASRGALRRQGNTVPLS